jgi:hypothetical protein
MCEIIYIQRKLYVQEETSIMTIRISLGLKDHLTSVKDNTSRMPDFPQVSRESIGEGEQAKLRSERMTLGRISLAVQRGKNSFAMLKQRILQEYSRQELDTPFLFSKQLEALLEEGTDRAHLLVAVLGRGDSRVRDIQVLIRDNDDSAESVLRNCHADLAVTHPQNGQGVPRLDERTVCLLRGIRLQNENTEGKNNQTVER